MKKKLALETKIRDAALNLSKVNVAHKKVSKQTSEQVEVANKRVESAQKELWKVSDRTNEVYRRLMEHRAGVLSLSVRNLEKMSSFHGDSGYDSSNRSTLLSPISSVTGSSAPIKSRFDGAHLFAGHADAIVPKPKISAEAAAAELWNVEEKLKDAEGQLAVASKKRIEMARELSIMKLEKQEVETTLGMDLQAAEETISALEREIPRLEDLNLEVQRLRQEKSSWEKERVQLVEQEKQQGTGTALSAALSTLETIIEQYGIELSSQESSLLGSLDGVSRYLEMVHGELAMRSEEAAEWETTRNKLEEDLRSMLDEREILSRELEDARRQQDAELEKRTAIARELAEVRRERDAARRDSPQLRPRVRFSSQCFYESYSGNFRHRLIYARHQYLQILYQVMMVARLVSLPPSNHYG